MNGRALLDRVQAETETERSRLGSEKSLLAATDARLESEAVLGVVADALATGQRHLEDWAEAAEDPALADALAGGARRLGTLRDDHRDHLPSEPTVAAHDPLEEPAGDLARASAGLLGLPLVLSPLCLQAVNFFVNEADRDAADAMREIRAGVEEIRAASQDPLAARASELGAEDEAVAAAVAVVESAYADYAESLGAMGLDPKPIC